MADAALALRVFHLHSDQLLELAQSPAELPARGFVWHSQFNDWRRLLESRNAGVARRAGRVATTGRQRGGA